ncbi:MAG: hypothetical protein MI802_01460 [Desulfobacterales bacterium]|nr:hypothetical protein [Desulfobacterales bacterium]
MKEKILIGVLLIMAAGFGLYKFMPASSPALNVDEVASDPGAYVGTITLAGVTSGFAQDDKTLFGIMDLKELTCTSTTCNKAILPIRYQGPLPRLWDEVRVTGVFANDGNGYYLNSETLVVVTNHKQGG